MTYVSCSPYMVPVAWLAAAQAEVKWPGEVQAKASRADKKRSHGSNVKRRETR
jgi:hypothetical protein